jgi:hypothetical protein
MFYVTQVLEQVLYYCDFKKYVGYRCAALICNYKQQYVWHSDILEYKYFLKGRSSPRDECHVSYICRYNYYGINQRYYNDYYSSVCRRNIKLVVNINHGCFDISRADLQTHYFMSWNNIRKVLNNIDMTMYFFWYQNYEGTLDHFTLCKTPVYIHATNQKIVYDWDTDTTHNFRNYYKKIIELINDKFICTESFYKCRFATDHIFHSTKNRETINISFGQYSTELNRKYTHVPVSL